MTKIEWTEKTWNPVAGCSVTSPGCKNCYAMRTAHRLGKIGATAPKYASLTKVVNGKVVWTGVIGEGSDAEWEKPLGRRKPTVWFVNSMGDLFHPNVTAPQIDRAFAIMARCPHHRFQILTKYPVRMRSYVRGAKSRIFALTRPDQPDALARHGSDPWWPLPHIWLGVSVEDQTRANERIPILLDTPAAVRFISAEPLLGPVDLTQIHYGLSSDPNEPDMTWASVDALTGKELPDPMAQAMCQDVDLSADWQAKLDWVIVGGESGPNERSMHPDWARSLRDQCSEAAVPFFFKQWGTCIPWAEVDLAAGRAPHDRGVRYMRGMKSLDPKTLDGVVHHAMPGQV